MINKSMFKDKASLPFNNNWYSDTLIDTKWGLLSKRLKGKKAKINLKDYTVCELSKVIGVQ